VGNLVIEKAEEFLKVHEWVDEVAQESFEKLLVDYKRLDKLSNRAFKKNDKNVIQIKEKSKQLQLISKKLSKYVPPQLYDTVFKEEEISITSRRRKLTIFFSSIDGFDSVTENIESEDLTALINSYLTEMSHIATEYGGTIDKFMGDSIMIFFGDPESRGHKVDAVKCVSMAIDMQRKMRDIRNDIINSGILRPIHIKIGITTGYVTVGNFGSDNRMDYTIIGNYVNLTSRLKDVAKKDQILVSEETYSLIKDDISSIRRDEIVAKGISYPVQTYEVLGYKNELSTKPIEIDSGGVKMSLDMSKIQDRELIIRELQEGIQRLERG
jgi:class 3 adenylate cyclase